MISSTSFYSQSQSTLIKLVGGWVCISPTSDQAPHYSQVVGKECSDFVITSGCGLPFTYNLPSFCLRPTGVDCILAQLNTPTTQSIQPKRRKMAYRHISAAVLAAASLAGRATAIEAITAKVSSESGRLHVLVSGQECLADVCLRANIYSTRMEPNSSSKVLHTNKVSHLVGHPNRAALPSSTPSPTQPVVSETSLTSSNWAQTRSVYTLSTRPKTTRRV